MLIVVKYKSVIKIPTSLMQVQHQLLNVLQTMEVWLTRLYSHSVA